MNELEQRFDNWKKTFAGHHVLHPLTEEALEMVYYLGVAMSGALIYSGKTNVVKEALRKHAERERNLIRSRLIDGVTIEDLVGDLLQPPKETK